jgi:Tol biopolymer transport system component
MYLRAATLIALLLAAGAAPGASASFPGKNGVIAAAEEDCKGFGDDGDTRAINVYDPKTGEIGEPLTDCTHDAYAPTWSADGARLGLAQATPKGPQLVSAAADGSDAQVIEAPTKGDGLSPFSGPAFAPDGQSIGFALDYEIWRSGVDGSNPKLLSKPKCKSKADCAEFDLPRWSPNGRLIAFEVSDSVYEGVMKPGIYVARASDGKGLRRVAKNGFAPDWSPDSRRLVYSTGFRGGRKGRVKGGNLYVARADGKGKPRLVARTRTTALTSPVWSPDGKSIAYVDLKFGSGVEFFKVDPNIYRSPARGGKRRKVASLSNPVVEEGDWKAPTLAWRPLP